MTTSRVIVAAVLLGAGCGPSAPPSPPPPLDVSAATLLRMYRDTPHLAENSYTGRRVRVRLSPNTHRREQGGVGWLLGFTDVPSAVLFLCEPPPGLREDDMLEIVGVCTGVTYDGVRRGPGVDWVIRIAEATATRHPAAP